MLNFRNLFKELLYSIIICSLTLGPIPFSPRAYANPSSVPKYLGADYRNLMTQAGPGWRKTGTFEEFAGLKDWFKTFKKFDKALDRSAKGRAFKKSPQYKLLKNKEKGLKRYQKMVMIMEKCKVHPSLLGLKQIFKKSFFTEMAYSVCKGIVPDPPKIKHNLSLSTQRALLLARRKRMATKLLEQSTEDSIQALIHYRMKYMKARRGWVEAYSKKYKNGVGSWEDGLPEKKFKIQFGRFNPKTVSGTTFVQNNLLDYSSVPTAVQLQGGNPANTNKSMNFRHAVYRSMVQPTKDSMAQALCYQTGGKYSKTIGRRVHYSKHCKVSPLLERAIDKHYAREKKKSQKGNGPYSLSSMQRNFKDRYNTYRKEVISLNKRIRQKEKTSKKKFTKKQVQNIADNFNRSRGAAFFGSRFGELANTAQMHRASGGMATKSNVKYNGTTVGQWLTRKKNETFKIKPPYDFKKYSDFKQKELLIKAGLETESNILDKIRDNLNRLKKTKKSTISMKNAKTWGNIILNEMMSSPVSMGKAWYHNPDFDEEVCQQFKDLYQYIKMKKKNKKFWKGIRTTAAVVAAGIGLAAVVLSGGAAAAVIYGAMTLNFSAPTMAALWGFSGTMALVGASAITGAQALAFYKAANQTASHEAATITMARNIAAGTLPKTKRKDLAEAYVVNDKNYSKTGFEGLILATEPVLMMMAWKHFKHFKHMKDHWKSWKDAGKGQKILRDWNAGNLAKDAADIGLGVDGGFAVKKVSAIPSKLRAAAAMVLLLANTKNGKIIVDYMKKLFKNKKVNMRTLGLFIGTAKYQLSKKTFKKMLSKMASLVPKNGSVGPQSYAFRGMMAKSLMASTTCKSAIDKCAAMEKLWTRN